jgi:3-hydroxyacyl-[acyl-carrier-protein] dehydratase
VSADSQDGKYASPLDVSGERAGVARASSAEKSPGSAENGADASASTEIVEVIDILRIMEMIPHRHPFLLIDRVENVVGYESAVGIKNVSINEQFFQGHFPNLPVMPGVLIVEAMAQTAAVLVVSSLGDESAGKLVFFMSIDKARFRKPVVPGDVIRLETRVLQHRGNVWKFEGRAMVNGQLHAEAVFAAMIMDS